jgi:hypothetical protein
MTSGGGLTPASPSAVAASAIRLAAFSAAISRVIRRLRPGDIDLATSSTS